MPKSEVYKPVMFGLEGPDDILATAEHFYNEWCNGGLTQFFSNWSPGDAQLVPKALHLIGASEAAAVVESAMAILGPAGDWGDKAGAAMMEYKTHPLAKPLWDLSGKIDDVRLWQLIEEYELKLAAKKDGDVKRTFS